MAKKNNNNNATKKKKSRGKSGGVANSANVPRSDFALTHQGGVAPSLRRTLMWTYVGSANSLGAGAYQEQSVILLNSPYDPDAALGGISANGFAKYMAFYSKCFTLGARLKVRICNSAGSTYAGANPIVLFGLTISTLTASLGNVTTASSTGLTSNKFICGSPDTGELMVSVDVGKFLHKPKVLDDPQLFCTSSGNPTQLIAAHFWNFGFSIAGSAYGFILEMEQDVIFTDPIPFT